MKPEIEAFIKSLSSNELELFLPIIEHSLCFYSLNGEFLSAQLSRENLLAVIEGKERYVVDNIPWKQYAATDAHKNKAFIIGHTILNEAPSFKGTLFNDKIKIGHNNLFVLRLSDVFGPCVVIERVDSAYRSIFDRIFTTDSIPSEEEAMHHEEIRSQAQKTRDHIRSICAGSELESFSPDQMTDEMKRQLSTQAQTLAHASYLNWDSAFHVACLCYASLLLDRTKHGDRARRKFTDPDCPNFFGDAWILQNALWLKARILSSDEGLKEMVGLLSNSEVNVVSSL